MAPSRTVIAHYALNGQMRSKVHTALTAPMVLHHRICKRAMKKIIINGQMWNKHFWIVICHSSLVKASMMLHAFVNCAMVLKKRLNFFFFHWPKAEQRP
jgi:hypothetical protein